MSSNSVILSPQDKDFRRQFAQILTTTLVPSVSDPSTLVANQWLVFAEEPEALVERGDAIDVLRSPADVFTLPSGDTEEQINAWVIEKKPRNPVKNQILKDQPKSATERGVGKVKVDYTFVLGCVQSLRKGAVQHAAETGAVRRAFNQMSKLGFTSPLDKFIDSHTGLTETICDKEKFGSAWVFYSEFEITVHVFEIYN